MEFGIGISTCREGWDYPPGFGGPREIIKSTQLAERLGFDFVWGSDFISPMPKQLSRLPKPPNWYDVLIGLAACSSVTKRIKLGIGVLVMPFREPIILAKQLATLDAFSGGRVLFGVGIGALREELEAIMPRAKSFHRGRMQEEQLEALNLLFTRDQATFKGQYYEFEGVTLYPRPVQNPFPVYFSGHAEETFRRVAKWGQGYVMGTDTPLEVFRQTVERVRHFVAEAGRDPSALALGHSGVISLGRTHEEAGKRFLESMAGQRRLARPGVTLEKALSSNYIGTPTEVAEAICQLRETGMTHCIVPSIASDTYQEMEEQAHLFAEEVVPLVRNG